MSSTISWTMNVQVSDGPKVSESRSDEVEAYGVVEVEIANDSVDVTVELQPGGASELKFLLIRSDVYGSSLTYSYDGGANSFALDQPQLFMGSGAIGIIGSPESLIFNNGEADSAAIEILVGRDATA